MSFFLRELSSLPFFLMYIQMAIEAGLVILLLLLWWRTRAPRTADPARLPENLQNSLENFLAESDRIAAEFDRLLKEKKDLTTDLLLKLDRRLSDYQVLFKQTEAGFNAAQKKLAGLRRAAGDPARSPAASAAKANPAAPEVRALVLQMAKKGHPPEEIAAKARLHLGEVELIIDLERQFNV